MSLPLEGSLQASGATPPTDENADSPFEGGAGDVPTGMTQRHPPQPKGCCPPQGGIPWRRKDDTE